MQDMSNSCTPLKLTGMPAPALIENLSTLINKQIKYQDNIEDPANLNLDYDSRESETKFRFEHYYLSKTKFKMLGRPYLFVASR